MFVQPRFLQNIAIPFPLHHFDDMLRHCILRLLVQLSPLLCNYFIEILLSRFFLYLSHSLLTSLRLRSDAFQLPPEGTCLSAVALAPWWDEVTDDRNIMRAILLWVPM